MTRGLRGFLALALLCLSQVSAFALDDYRTRVAVIPVRNLTSDTRYDAVCTAVTETVALGLRLLGTYLVVDQDQDPALAAADPSSLEGIEKIATQARYDEVLFGEATKSDDGTLTFGLTLFNVKEAKTKQRVESQAATIFDVFDAADEITVSLLSKISNIHIGFGSLDIKNLSEKGSWTVFLNGNRIRNPKGELRKVLNGRYTVAIHQDRLLGDTIIYQSPVDIYEDQTAVVSFSIPAATPEEVAFLRDREKRLTAASADPKNVDGLLREIASFQELSRKASFDPTLGSIQKEALTSAGAKATAALNDAMKQVDSAYYGRNPNYAALKTRYESLSKLVNSVFDYRAVGSGGDTPIAQPTEVVWAPDGTTFVLDHSPSSSVRVLDSQGGIVRTVGLDAKVGEGRIAADQAANLYFAKGPSDDSILMFDKALGSPKTISIADFVPDDKGKSAFTVSDEGVIYLVNGASAYVFEPGHDRMAEIETAIAASLKSGGISCASSVFFDADGFLNVFGDGKLARLDSTGNLQSTVSFPQSETDSRAAVDTLGYFYITMPNGNCVLKFSPQGEQIACYGKYGVNAGEFSYPEGIATTSDGSLLIADAYNNRVQLFSLSAPPVLLPEVAKYGLAFSTRQDASSRAQQRLAIVQDNTKMDHVIGPVAGSAGMAAAAIGVTAAGGYFLSVAQDAYKSYQTSTDFRTIYGLRTQISQNWMYSQIANVGVGATLFGAAALISWGLLTGGDYAVARSEVVSETQATSLDATYELDRSRYRNLRSVESIGFWTGVMPPIIGGLALATAGLGIPALSSINQPAMPISLALAVAIPPIWSHLSAGKFPVGLFAAGLAADATAVAAAFVAASRAPGWAPTDLASSSLRQYPTAYPMLNNAWRQIQKDLPMYLGVSAIGIRLAAGIYDYNKGWLEAKDFNLYRAVKKVTPQVSLMIVPTPMLDGAGIALALRY